MLITIHSFKMYQQHV